MIRIVFGIFIVLHGLVHLLYFGQSRRLFELQSGMVWPDGSWAFSKLLGTGKTRLLASILCALVAIGFVVAGIGVFAGQSWWRPLVLVSASLSTAVYILFWDGKLRKLDNQGGVGILINIALVVAAYILRWPDLGF